MQFVDDKVEEEGEAALEALGIDEVRAMDAWNVFSTLRQAML